jgi:hypothetical protein
MSRALRGAIIESVTVASGQRTCPHCQSPNPLDLGKKCVACRKALPPYCFSCYAPLPDEKTRACASCGRPRWVFGDHAELACAVEAGGPRRQHRWMATITKGGQVLHEWRCLKCLTDETRTDAFTHFPAEASAT